MADVRVRLLGGFDVTVDGRTVPDRQWARRHAAAIVKVLALAPGHRLHREQLIDAVWPDDPLDRAAAKLHKAAHYARRAVDFADAVVLRDEFVLLFPGTDLTVDVDEFAGRARTALATRDKQAATAALGLYRGELAPEDPYEEWAARPREELRLRHLDLLRLAGRWAEVVEHDPTDEDAYLELMREHAGNGDRHAALRQFERLDRALRRELGVGPGRAAVELRDRLLAAAPTPTIRPSELVGRERELSAVEAALDAAERGRCSVLLVAAPPGMGKSALLAQARRRAAERGWRVGQGSASAIEAPWPYAPIVGALADMCRRHPALLDGLADTYRTEIDRVLAAGNQSWTGDSSHQRLFVACSELVYLASPNGLLITVDDLHEADEASLRLLHYLARASVDQPVALLLAYRSADVPKALSDVCDSLVARHGAVQIEPRALDRDAVTAIVGARVAGATGELIDQIAALSGGVPFAVEELARRAADEPEWTRHVDIRLVAGIDPRTREVLQRVAVAGLSFDTDQFVALSGLDTEEAYDHLDKACGAGVIEVVEAGYRFRHGLVRDALLAEVPPHRRRGIHRDAAHRLQTLGANASQIGYHLLEAGEGRAAADHLIAAAESAAAVGAYRDALDMIEPVRVHTTASNRTRLMSLRADLLSAIGDPSASSAYRDALDEAPEHLRRQLLTRLARASTMSGDVATAAAALEGVDPDGGPLDAEILLAKANVAFFTADVESAWAIAREAERRVLGGERNWKVLNLVSLLGLLSHQRGEWFDRMRVELRRTRDDPEIANSIFDGHLCAAQYVLYGSTPYAEIIDLAEHLRSTAQRSGALRAVAFATALIGESALHVGDLDRAERELREAASLHHDLDSGAGEAHSLQRLAEVFLLRSDSETARGLLHQALPLARWSLVSSHLLQRIHGTLIAAAADPIAARAEVDRAEAALGTDDLCPFCTVMLSVPAAIACARVDDVANAQRHLMMAEHSALLWQSQAWEASTAEAAGHVALAQGDAAGAAQRFAAAEAGFLAAGHAGDARRCQALAGELAAPAAARA